MRALLMEREGGISDPVAAALVAADFEVHRCRPPASRDYECEGMQTGHGCPLDEAGTDVAVAVRPPEGGPVTDLEAGVGCALRLGVPVTLVGGGDGAGYLPLAASVATGVGDLLPAVEAAIELGRDRLRDPARSAARRALGDGGGPAPIEVQVEFVGDRLRAEVQVGVPLDARTRETIAVRVAGVLRPRATWARAVDVAVRGLGE